MHERESLMGLLSWRCGYATGLDVALKMMRECRDPPSRIKREFESATAEAQRAWKAVGRPRFARD